MCKPGHSSTHGIPEGILCIFLSTGTYLIDSFHIYSASALASVVTVRSLTGFGFPLFASTSRPQSLGSWSPVQSVLASYCEPTDEMFRVLGMGWGNSLCALITIIFLPAPWIFYRYGPRIRSRSRFTRKFAGARASQAVHG
jgi:DHA1 family multidrug resistance protein-like MFS transporter